LFRGLPAQAEQQLVGCQVARMLDQSISVSLDLKYISTAQDASTATTGQSWYSSSRVSRTGAVF
jgi:hypothetical protein